MKLLVTGHLGYIGTVMVPVLLRAGHEVIGCDSDLYQDCSFNAGGVIAPVPNLRRDIRDLTTDDLVGIDAVIHLAALSNDTLGNLNPEVTYSINHLGTVQLAKMAKAAGVQRFIVASSCANYGHTDHDLIDETGALNPVSPYGQSKVWSEHDTVPLAGEGFCPVFMRLPAAFGVSPRMRFDVVLNNLVAWAVTKGVIYLKSDGTPWRPIVHVEDVARAFLAALEAPGDKVFNQSFNVGSNAHNYRIRDLAQIVVDRVPGCRLEFAPHAGSSRRSYRVNFEKIERILPGFRAEWDARRGTEQLYEAFCASGLTLDAVEGPRYQRILHLRKLIADGVIDPDLRFASARRDREPMPALAS